MDAAMFMPEDTGKSEWMAQDQTILERLPDQLLWGEYLLLADEFLNQGRDFDTYREVSWLTAKRLHVGTSVLLSVVGGFVTAAALNKIIAGALPDAFRGTLGLLAVMGIASLLVWSTVQVLAYGLQAYALTQRIQGMVDATDGLPQGRRECHRIALLPLRGELRRYQKLWIGLFGFGLLGGIVDAAALYNLVSLYLTSDAPWTKWVATIVASFITLFVIGGKAVFDCFHYYLPMQLHAYGRMYQDMAGTQERLLAALRPGRWLEEKKALGQRMGQLQEELNQALNQVKQFQEEMDNLKAGHAVELQQLLQAAQAVIASNRVFGEVIQQLAHLVPQPSLPPAIEEVRE